MVTALSALRLIDPAFVPYGRLPQIIVRFRKVRPYVRCPLVRRDCLVQLPLLNVRIAEIIMRFGKIGLIANDLVNASIARASSPLARYTLPRLLYA